MTEGLKDVEQLSKLSASLSDKRRSTVSVNSRSTCSLTGPGLSLWLLLLGTVQSLAKLGGAPSIFLMVLPDRWRVRLQEAACWPGAGAGGQGADIRDLSRGDTRGLVIIQPDCLVNITSLPTVLPLIS